MFLSLVVNYRGETHCKLAIATEGEEVEKKLTRNKWKLKGQKSYNNKNDYVVTKKPVNNTYTIECTVVYEHQSWLVDECDLLDKEKKAKKAYRPPVHTTPSLQQNAGYTNLQFKVPTSSYTKIMPVLSDLLTLGTASMLTPFEALQKLSSTMYHGDNENFRKAFKQYFVEEWFDQSFYTTPGITVKEVVANLQHFLGHHKHLFFVSNIKEALDEIIKEEAKF